MVDIQLHRCDFRHDVYYPSVSTQVTQRFGEYKPLSWYWQQGYDAALVEKNCTDFMECPVFGTVYRVPFHGGGTNSTSGTCRTDSLNSDSSTSAPPAVSGSASAHNGLDSATSDAAAAKAKAKAALAEAKKLKLNASSVVTKLAADLLQVEVMLKSKGFKQFAPVDAQGKYALTHSQLKDASNLAKQVLAGKCDAGVQLPDAKHVAELSKTAKLQTTWLQSLIQNSMMGQMP